MAKCYNCKGLIKKGYMGFCSEECRNEWTKKSSEFNDVDDKYDKFDYHIGEI